MSKHEWLPPPEKYDPALHTPGDQPPYDDDYATLIGYGANDFGWLDLEYEKYRAKECRRAAQTFQRQVEKYTRAIARTQNPRTKAAHQESVDRDLPIVARNTREAEEHERRIREYGGRA